MDSLHGESIPLRTKQKKNIQRRDVVIAPLSLRGTLQLPAGAKSLVIFAHGSGSSRFSPRNVAVADSLNEQHMATLLFDLLTQPEERNRSNVFDIGLLAARLVDVIHWARQEALLRNLPIGLFGASTGAGAALVAAASLGENIRAVVSRGGRPDLAGADLERVTAPTLLIVGGDDHGVIELNQQAFAHLNCPKRLEIVAGATHLFEEPGAMEQVIYHAVRWFQRHLNEHASFAALY